MVKNKKNQAADISFWPVVKVAVWCLLIGGSAIGYDWEKNQLDRLGRQISERESSLRQLKNDNKMLADQIAFLQSPLMLDRRVNELRLGMGPAEPSQVIRLMDLPVQRTEEGPRQLAQRPAPGGAH